MPPKAKFTRDEVIEAAVNIVGRDGAQALTARALAEELKSSPRPIFTVFNGMEEVWREVVIAAKTIYTQYVDEGLKQQIAFRGVGESYIRFAKERPKLFALLFMTEQSGGPDSRGVLSLIDENHEKILQSIVDGYAVDGATATSLYVHMWTYTHGIAVLIATKVCSFTDEEITEKLTQVFKSLYICYRTGQIK